MPQDACTTCRLSQYVYVVLQQGGFPGPNLTITDSLVQCLALVSLN